MLTYIIRRLLLMIPTLIGVTMMVFFIMAYAPGGFQAALDDGSQGVGDEARRLKQEMKNRYGLDQPAMVQYLRWLNQVSPIGFRMSGDKKWDEQTRQELFEQLQQRDWITSESSAKARLEYLLITASYLSIDTEEALALFDAAAAEPVVVKTSKDEQGNEVVDYVGAGPELFELIEEPPLEGDKFWAKIAEKSVNDPAGAADDLFREYRYCSTGKSRVDFSAIKLWDPDLGTDQQSKRPVIELIKERLPITLLMNVITIPLIYIVSIVAGILAARRRGGFFDVTSGAVMLAFYSVPVILAGTLMIAYLASSKYLHWFPASGMHDLQADAMPFLPYFKDGEFYRGYLLDFAWHLVLPITCLTYAGFAFLTKVMRGSVLETISADFVRTARAKGVSEHHILFRHVLRNSLLPLITMAAAILPGLFVGSFVVEFIFSIQGMGLLTIEAAKNKEVNIMMATTLVGALLSLFSLLLRDILYAIADPRVSYE